MTIRVFVSGQSNVLGRASGGPDWALVDSRVRVWNSINPLGANGTAFTDPASARTGGTFDQTNRNNLAVWFCDRLARHADDDVDMTIVARGATDIVRWFPGESEFPMLQECIDVWAATGQPPADVFLWHQGEGNLLNMTRDEYRGHFLDLLDNLEAGGVITASTIVVVGGLSEAVNADKVDFNIKALRRLAQNNNRIGYASARALSTTDGTHFDGASLYTFGTERYFTGYLQAQAMTLYALVNDGGTPGTPGSGTNKVLNLDPILENGYRLRGGPLYLTVDQDYEHDPEVIAIAVEVVGGGGGGGGASSSGAIARPALGGAAGGYAYSFIENPDASYAVVIGAAGAGGAAGQNAGTAGGTTSFGTISCGGGNGGAATGSSADVIVIGATSGGAASGGEVNIAGNSSVPGYKLTAAARMSGGGGDTKYGSGGPNRVGTTTASNSAGVAGSGYGAGGSGGVSSTTVDQPGGDGTPGVVVVWEYIR